MAARKLQSEVDRTLKRVTEGVEAFQEQYQKMQASSNQTQKEKIEADLKQQIKRLQRMRDSIKTWLGSNEIKDKQPLTDSRKLIETQMELFKACEKEMKTKAFSKEGLSAAVKLDPMDVLKEEMSNFISETVTELGRQIEVAEAEVESLQGGAKKKRGAPNERIAEVEALNERRRWHVSRLELILRLLENGQIPPTKVADIQTDVKYFLESNTEEDFVEDEGIYDDLDLEQTEEQFGLTQDDLQSSHDTSSIADTSDYVPQPPAPRTPAKEPVKAAAKAAPVDEPPAPVVAAKKAPAAPAPAARKATLDGTAARPTAAQIKSAPAPVPTPRTVPPPVQPVRYSVAAAAAVAPSTPTATVQSTPVPAPAPAPAPAAPPSLPAPTPSASVVSPAPTASPAKPLASAVSAAQSSASPAPSSISSAPPPPSAPSASGASPASASVALPSPPPSSMLPLAEPTRPGSTQPPESATSPTPSSARMASNSLGDLLTTFESAKSKAQRGAHDLGAIQQVLQAGYSNIPQPQDAERPRHYAPKVPYPTPEYYPQQPLTALETPAMFAKLDIDTLFYIFYYQPGTYSQHLAAQELKAKSWRFHTSYLTWFQRAQEPDTITDEYEQGVYHYFDWESGWSSRRKTGFRFEYKALEAF